MFGPSHPGEIVQGLAFSPDGDMLAVLTDKARLDVWRVDTGETQMAVQANTSDGSDVAFAPDSKTLVTAGGDGAAVWNLRSREKILSLSSGGTLAGVAFSADGSRIATAGEDRRARIWDAETGLELLKLELPNAVTSIAFSPDGTELAAGDANGIVRAFALRVDDLVRLARERLRDTPTPSGPSAPSQAVSSGPQGAFRVTIVEKDLLRHGFPPSDVADQIGDYTLALTDGSFRLHQRDPDGNTSETSGTYAITGDGITFTEWADAGCAGNRFSAVWRSRGPVLRLSDVRSEILPRCEPQLVRAWARAVFASHPWTIVGGAMSG
jgi:WD40 repeat protein